MRRYLFVGCLALLCALATGCTTSDREYVRNHIVRVGEKESDTKSQSHKEAALLKDSALEHRGAI